MASYYGEDFDAAVRRLRREFALPVPVRIQTVPARNLGEYLAWCIIYRCEAGNPTKAVIQIARKLNREFALHLLTHEFAHAIDEIKNGNSRLSHRVSWGKEYARAYQAVFGKH